RFITLPTDTGSGYLLLEDALTLYLTRFFPGEQILEAATFRITRNADLELREDSALDLMEGMQDLLDARKESPCVRLDISSNASPEMRKFLQERLRVGSEFVFDIPGPIDLAAFFRL